MSVDTKKRVTGDNRERLAKVIGGVTTTILGLLDTLGPIGIPQELLSKLVEGTEMPPKILETVISTLKEGDLIREEKGYLMINDQKHSTIGVLMAIGDDLLEDPGVIAMVDRLEKQRQTINSVAEDFLHHVKGHEHRSRNDAHEERKTSPFFNRRRDDRPN